MIRDVVLHLLSEQPLLADLDALPTPVDGLIICTNLRMMNGNRPIFVDDSASTFVFPVAFVRFIEVPAKSMAGFDRMGRQEPGRGLAAGAPEAGVEPVVEEEPEIDEGFLQRIRDV
ncbi:MAG TPA: hypothetical protein VF323_10860 [Candidatus Limnocylindrales bacterium]